MNPSRLVRLAAGLGAFVALAAAGGGSASAHVSIAEGEVAAGSTAILTISSRLPPVSTSSR